MRDISFIGANTGQTHELDFTINRPKGYPVYSFCHFYTPTILRTRSGLSECGDGDCIIFDLDFPQIYHGKGVGFVNDWVDIGSPDMPPFLKAIGLPTNTILRPYEPIFITQLVEEIRSEWLNGDRFWKLTVASLMEQLLVLVARAVRTHEGLQRKAPEYQHLDALRYARKAMYRRVEYPWNVDAIARSIHLSTSRFNVLYRRLFGVSPMEDLINARMERAKRLLLNEQAPVSDIAGLVGYIDVHYFSRLFKKKCGYPPSLYYSKCAGPRGSGRK